jgi:pyruvate dehydrogenase E2 component (dihydrolipoamide acetyltransferase)
MATEVRLPELAESMKSARVAAWLKREGDRVTAGEPLLELETDKTNVEVESPHSGVLHKICVPAGAEVPGAGGVLALITEGEVADDGAPPVLPEAAGEAVASPSTGVTAFPAAVPGALPPLAVGAAPTDAGVARHAVTPLARRMAALAGVDLAAISGSGPGGRIGKADVERVLRTREWPRRVGRTAAPPASAAPPPALEAREPYEDRPVSAMRRVTGTRLTAAKQQVPHFYLQVDCHVDGLAEMRRSINDPSAGIAITLTDCVVRAVALALRRVPQANSAWTGTALRVYESIDIAVAVNTPAGLITPVVRSADAKGLRAISAEIKALAERARAGQLGPSDYTGGTFTISNLGMFGITSMYAIVNPPQSCILGVGAAISKPIVRGGAVVPGTVMTCTLSGDHRAIDGAAGAELLAAVRRNLENPWLLTT